MKFVKQSFAVVMLSLCSFNWAYGQSVQNDDMDALPIPNRSIPADLQEAMPTDVQNNVSERSYNADGSTAVIETLFVRPLGLVTMICGTGLFIGMSPLTALASIPSPHDAFVRTANALIVGPAEYTFKRRLGDFSYQSRN
jgi:hypothetical protein